MGLRCCDAIHFIQTIRRGLVTKVCNADSNGRPRIVYQSLKDIYESENAIRRRKSGPDLVFENPILPVADRTLEEIKSEPDEFVCHAGNGGSSELDDNCHAGNGWSRELDDSTTLKQLRERFLTKKRKLNDGNKANEEPVEGDLYEPLITLKSKRSKTKRECKNPRVLSTSNVDFTVKAEKILSSEDDSLQCCGQFDHAVLVKVEIPDTEQVECQNNASAANSSMGHRAGADPSGLASMEYQKMDQQGCRDQQQRHENCVTNEVSYDHLEVVEPISMLFHSDGKNANIEPLESVCEELLSLLPSVIENGKEIKESDFCRISMSLDANSGACSNSGCSDLSKISEQSCSTGIQVSGMITETDYPCKQDSFLSVADTKCGYCPDSLVLLQATENVNSAEGASPLEEKPSTHAFDDTTKNDLNCEVHIEHEFCKDEEKQTSASPASNAESSLCLKNQNCESSETLSTSEHASPERLLSLCLKNQSRESSETLSTSEHASPERLLSTRKAMSPSSEERLCMVMNSIELGSDAGLSTVRDCKGKFFGRQTVKKVSVVRTEDSQCDKSTDSQKEQASPQKVFISPRIIKKRSKIAKGNLEGPHFSRTLPNLSTGCTSIQGCSESAVAFSQRQMHDMESLAEKLMNELKAMKDIVEQKLLFEAYRSTSLKNDADGVKSAINSATKVEDTARKWLSIMSRDCNRFCKIMKMTPNSTTTAKDVIPRGRKRVIFADEAGGKLCHIKFFGDGDFANADDVKQ